MPEEQSRPTGSRKSSRPPPPPPSFNRQATQDAVDVIKPAPVFYRPTSHVSGPDAFEPSPPPSDYYVEAGDDIYDRLSPRRKTVVLIVMSFCAFLSPVSSTSVLAATPEVAQAYKTTGSIVDLTNAVYVAFMAMSPIVFGPASQVFGRRPVTLFTAGTFLLASLATALSPDLAAFFVFRALSALVGTCFILLGSSCLGDIYRPTERGTAIGWFLSGTVVGPALGPFLGGVVVTYSSWRSIFWLQTALAGTGLLGVVFLVPETIHRKTIEDLEGYSRIEKAKAVLDMMNPIRVIKLFRYPNQVFAALASSALLWNMYSLLTPIRYVLNPRFHLQSPLLSGLIYLAPGTGYVVGTFMGGRWADLTVRKWIKKRNGERVPEDRLRSALPFIGILIPACILVYGWSVDKAVGGIPVPIIMLFLQGIGQLMTFPSLNTYCLDVMPGRGAEVTAGNYFMRYVMGCVATAVVLPADDSIGVGWFSTISSLLLVLATLGLMAAIRWGKGWREKIDSKNQKPPHDDGDESAAAAGQEKKDSNHEQGQSQGHAGNHGGEESKESA